MRIISRQAAATGAALIVSLAAVAVAAPALVSAQSTTADSGNAAEMTKAEKAKKDAETRLKAAQDRAAAKKAEFEQKKADRTAKLEAKKLDVCKKREAAIGQLMGRLNTRGEKHLELIKTITTRVEGYKTDKNLTVANYDALLAEVNVKKALAEKAVAAVKDAKVEFKCDGTDPKGAASLFKEQMQAQNEALKAYKSSVIKLLVAVKQSQGDKTKTPTPPSTPPPVIVTVPPLTPPTPPTPATPPTGPTPPANEGGEQ